MQLEGKTVVIYGAGGVIGSAVARAMAREGAVVYLTGRTRSRLEVVARDIQDAGGVAHTAVVDAQDADAVAENMSTIVAEAGSIDVAFNATGEDNNDFGIPLVDLTHEAFTAPIASLTRTHFLTATIAGRLMASQGRGTILTLSSSVAKMPGVMPGGFRIACGAIESMSEQLGLELGPQGVRVICLRPDGILESARMGSITADVWGRAAGRMGITLDEFLDTSPPDQVLPATVTLDDVANVATFMASDHSAGMTATVVNISTGKIRD